MKCKNEASTENKGVDVRSENLPLSHQIIMPSYIIFTAALCEGPLASDGEANDVVLQNYLNAQSQRSPTDLLGAVAS